MWWYTALFATLLFAQCAEGNVWIRREMSTIPLMDMTDVDIKQLSTAILTEFTKVGFTCPERARSMLAFGLMMPKIPISFPYVRQRVFGPTSMVPVAVQDEVTRMVIDNVMVGYGHRIEAIPEYRDLVQSLGSIGGRTYVFPPYNAANIMTGTDVIAHIRNIMVSLKGISCERMVNVKIVKSFMTKVSSILNTQTDVIINQNSIASIIDRIPVVIPNQVIASKVIAHVIPTSKWIIHDMYDTVVAMAQVVPSELPIDVVLHKLVSMYRPQMEIHGMEPAAVIAPTVMKFPVVSDPCYEQKFAAYNIVLLRMFSTMRINMVGHLLMGHVKAMDMNAICKPLSTLFKYNVIEELMPEPLYADMKPVMDWSKLITTIAELKRAGQINTVTIVEPLNELLNVISGPAICGMKPAEIINIVNSAFSSYQQTFETDVVVKYLKGKIATPEIAEFMTAYKPMAQTLKMAFDVMFAEYQINTMSAKPIFAFSKMLQYVDNARPLRWTQGCMGLKFAAYGSFPSPSIIGGMNAFKPSMFKKIAYKYANVLTGILEGGVRRPIDVGIVGEIVKQVTNTLVDLKQSDVDGLQAILQTWGGVPIEMVPTDVVMKTMIAMTRKIQQQVPTQCRLPLGIKFLAALISSHEQIGVGPAYPFMPLLAPVVRLGPASSIPLVNAKEIIGMVAYQLHIASAKAMANLAIFKGIEPVADLVKVVIKDVAPSTTITEIYSKVIPRLTSLIPEVAVCKEMSVDDVLAEGYTYMDRLFNSAELSRSSIDAILGGIVPAVSRRPIVDAFIRSGLPIIESAVRRFMWGATPFIQLDPVFAKFHSGWPVETEPLDIAKIEGGFKPQVYKVFLEELRTRLTSHLLPITNLPTGVLEQNLAEAYMKTLRILGIPT